MSETGWTEDRVTTLKKLWLQGLSASQIAKQLGGCTRNAVIAKVHRLGLSNRDQASAPKFSRYGVAPRSQPPAPEPRPVKALRPTTQRADSYAARGQTQKIKAQKPEQKLQAAPGQRWAGGELRLAKAPAASVEPFVDTTVRPDERGTVTLLELKHSHCRWPIGDPAHDDFAFCGQRRDGERPYCSQHSRRAFQPAKGWLSDTAVGLADPRRKHKRASVPTFDDYDRRARG